MTFFFWQNTFYSCYIIKLPVIEGREKRDGHKFECKTFFLIGPVFSSRSWHDPVFVQFVKGKSSFEFGFALLIFMKDFSHQKVTLYTSRCVSLADLPYVFTSCDPLKHFVWMTHVRSHNFWMVSLKCIG